MKMLLLLLLSVSSAATFVVNVSQSSYQAEENQDITLEWTFTSRPDTSWTLLFILCELIAAEKVSYLYHIHEGLEVSESQDQQFAGRVHCDEDVLREGRLRLHVSKLRTEDSGLYLCDVKTEDGSSSGMCRLSVAAEKFQRQIQIQSPQPENRRQKRLHTGKLITVLVLVLVLVPVCVLLLTVFIKKRRDVKKSITVVYKSEKVWFDPDLNEIKPPK